MYILSGYGIQQEPKCNLRLEVEFYSLMEMLSDGFTSYKDCSMLVKSIVTVRRFGINCLQEWNG